MTPFPTPQCLHSPLGKSLLLGSAIAVSVLWVVSCKTLDMGGNEEEAGSIVQMTELRQTIQVRVTDPARSAELMRMTTGAEQTLGSLNKSFRERSQEFGKMSSDHKKTGAELQNYMRVWDTEDHNNRARLINLMQAMKAQTTEAEWPFISNALLDSVLRQSDRYQSIQNIQY